MARFGLVRTQFPPSRGRGTGAGTCSRGTCSKRSVSAASAGSPRTYARTGAAELWRDLVKPAFVAEMRRYVPALESRDVRFGPSGVRAQCLSVDGRLVEDFVFEEGERVLHVLNAPSPGATASLAIGRLIAERALRRFLPAQ